MDFGPERKSYHPEYPFWRLQKDGVWEITHTEDIHVTKSGDVRKRDLIKEDVSGGFPEVIFQKLQDDPQLFQDVVQELLDSNFPSAPLLKGEGRTAPSPTGRGVR